MHSRSFAGMASVLVVVGILSLLASPLAGEHKNISNNGGIILLVCVVKTLGPYYV